MNTNIVKDLSHTVLHLPDVTTVFFKPPLLRLTLLFLTANCKQTVKIVKMKIYHG